MLTCLSRGEKDPHLLADVKRGRWPVSKGRCLCRVKSGT